MQVQKHARLHAPAPARLHQGRPIEKKADEPAAGIILPLPPGLTRDAEIVNNRLTTLGIVAAVGYSPSRG